MSTTAERYHHGNLRAALVEQATALARAEGPAGLRLREVARRAGVSHNAAYRHFADRDALVRVVAQAGLAGLVAAMAERKAAVAETDPVRRARARLAECGRAYVLFALAEPGLFTVTFSAYPGLDPERSTLDEAHEPEADPFAELNSALDELVAVGYLTPERRLGAEMACWSTVHGFAVLHLDGPLRGRDPVERDVDLQRVLDAVDRGLGGD